MRDRPNRDDFSKLNSLSMNANLKTRSTEHRRILHSRADHVGSFLRPPYLAEARAKLAQGEITAAQLRDVIAIEQQAAKLRLVTEIAREVWGDL